MGHGPVSTHLLGAGLPLSAIHDVALWKRGEYAAGLPFNLRDTQPRMLERGWVFAGVTLPDGRRQELHLFLPGDFVDQLGCVDAGYDLIPASPVVIVDIPKSVSSRAEFQDFKAREQAMKDAIMLAHTLRLNRLDAIGRISHFLLETERRLRVLAGDNSPVLGWPLRQTHIADYLALSSAYVCRTLLKLKAAGLADVTRGLRIYDRQRLADVFDPARKKALAKAC